MDQQPPPDPQSAGTPPVGDPALPPAPVAAGAPPPAVPPPVAPAPSSAPAYWQGGAEVSGPAPGVEFAGYASRIVAYIVDGILVGVLVWVIVFFALLLGGGDLDIVSTILIGAGVLVGLAYFPFFWQRTGQTPGMQAMHIRVVRDKDGGPVGWGSAILRLIGYTINSIIFGLPIGWLWVFFDRRRRGWHDLIGSTVVVKA
jgi:uncharacterized RDD family membrane protein YckC